MYFRIKLFIVPICIFLFRPLNNYAQGSKNIDTEFSLNAADSFYYAHDWENAKKIFDVLLTDTSSDAVHLNRLGFCELNLLNYDATGKPFQRSLRQNPIPPVKASVYSRIARLNAINNNVEIAFANLDSAISAGYGMYEELDTLKDFHNLREDDRFKELRKRVYGIRFPCMINPKAREFDFWVGDWDVYVTGTKNYAGHNTIQVISGGCALLENWENSAGTGKSINFIVPLTNKWKQT